MSLVPFSRTHEKIRRHEMNRIFIILLISMLTLLARGQGNCGVTNVSFATGERITYVVSYTWLMLWVDVGEVTFTVKPDKKFNRNLLHLHSTGTTYSFYDWFFKVRDLYESWVDPVTLQPQYFNRSIYEGGYTKENEYKYDWKNNRIYVRIKRKQDPSRYDSLKIEKCTHDVVSAIYASRNLDFANMKEGKVFPVTAAFDDELFHVGFKFIKREEKYISGIGRFKCLKFQVDLVAGDIFKGDQKLYVWVTDDRNRVPVYIESPIKVGSIKVRVIDWSGLRHPLTSKVK